MIPPQAERVHEMDFRGIWRDDQGRIVEIVRQLDDGSWLGHFRDNMIPAQVYTKYLAVNTKDGTRLIERKRGEEKGWE